MNKLYSKKVEINNHDFVIRYFSEYDFPSGYDPQVFDGWDGILYVEYNVPDRVAISSSEAEKILDDAKNDLYHIALKIAEENPNVYGNFLMENNFQGRVSWSTRKRTSPYLLASKVKANFSFHKL